MNADNQLVVICCEQMNKELKEDYLMSVMLEEGKLMVHIQSDGGHGGLWPINYCPFCGSEIRMKQDLLNTNTWD